MKRLLFCATIIFWITSLLIAQQPATIKGYITGESGESLPGATIIELATGKGIQADANGYFQLLFPEAGKKILEISYIGYLKDTVTVNILPGEQVILRHKLISSPEAIQEIVVESWYDRAEALQQIDLKAADRIPLPSGNVESILSSLGASTRNEMSSQYSVRGGNFDENLVYVNDVEIYRPMLVKAGQQEGLSFVNSALISSIQFAAGGFDARYGDKMSSVLDIRYKRPIKFGGSASASLLGGSAHIEGTAIKGKFTHITGIRYKSNQYLLKTMQTKGEYNPNFFDLQTFLTYDAGSNLEISFLGNLARNSYELIPQSRKTSFGTYQQTFDFTVYYEGQERDRFSTLLGALAVDYHPSERLTLKFISSGFNTYEAVTYDILGQYFIDLLDNTAGSETSKDSILNIGYGGNLTHARNYLDANIFSLSHKGAYRWKNNHLNWGLGGQQEDFSDRIREWELIDSAGFSMPYSDSVIRMQRFTKAANHLTSWRYAGFIQNTSNFTAGSTSIMLNAGLRFNYLTTNEQLVVSPRLGIRIIPTWDKKLSFHAALGWYHQPPFYKEMSDPEGKLYTKVKAQRSIHFVVGSALDFRMWERPFRLSAEAYYKKLDHLIPYVIDDVDIQYLPQYTATGYATGIEFKINGEFVDDAESWATLSFLQTREDREGDAYGQYPRATDQLVNFGLFFQDYFPNNPSFRVHLNLFYGSRLPYNSTEYDNPEDYYYLRAYRRIDIGLSKSLFTDRQGNIRTGKYIRDLWFSLEVFNLFGFNNQASYQWIRTVSNQAGFPNMFAVPNYLTGRLLNLRMTVRF
ncbi:MAG: carboxypeptidase-like regulatory domain-containing protein [Bacteroidales bacterium]